MNPPQVPREHAGSTAPATGHAHRAQADVDALSDPHELGLLEVTLALTPQQRVDRLVRLHRTARALRHAVQE